MNHVDIHHGVKDIDLHADNENMDNDPCGYS